MKTLDEVMADVTQLPWLRCTQCIQCRAVVFTRLASAIRSICYDVRLASY